LEQERALVQGQYWFFVASDPAGNRVSAHELVLW
jgi:hypothetical protein